MKIRKIAIAAITGTALALSTHMQMALADDAVKYTEAPEDAVSSLVPLEEIYGVHAFVLPP